MSDRKDLGEKMVCSLHSMITIFLVVIVENVWYDLKFETFRDGCTTCVHIATFLPLLSLGSEAFFCFFVAAFVVASKNPMITVTTVDRAILQKIMDSLNTSRNVCRC